MKKAKIIVEFGYGVEDAERCNIEKGEVLNMLRLTVLLIENKIADKLKMGVTDDKNEETKLGSFLIKELVKRQEDDGATLTKTRTILDSFKLKLNRIIDGCVFPVLRKYNAKDIEIELMDVDNLDSKLPFLYDALKIAGVKDYKEPFNRNGFYTLEEVENQIWVFDKEAFKKSLNISSIAIK